MRQTPRLAPPFALPFALLLAAPPAPAAPRPLPPPALAAAAPRWDFGARGLGDPTPLTHTFLLRNTSRSPVVVDRLATSCHCTRAAPAGGRSLPLTLAPGAALALAVTVQTARLGPGPLLKTVWVFTKRGQAATLEITGTLRADAPR